MKKVSANQRKEYARRAKVKAKLLLNCKIDAQGFPLCPKCGKRPDYRGMQLSHKVALSQGGRTSLKNCEVLCASCHNGEDGHRVENMPHYRLSDQEESRLAALTGKYGNKCRPVPVSAQVGKKEKQDAREV